MFNESNYKVKSKSSDNTFSATATQSGWICSYPKVLTLQWKNGSDSATLTLTDHKPISAVSPVVNTNATIYGNPEYIRLGGKGTLNVQWKETNETASAPAIWEDNYTH